MANRPANAKIILGLKARQLREVKGLSFKELSAASGLSISYLNEIEKGKKYPKPDRLAALATALDTTAAELSDPRLLRELAPVAELLNSNFLNDLPLDLFGIDLTKVVALIANAPTKVSAFIKTLLELSRNYALGEENFYFGALRSYLELHSNYFPELEKAVDDFKAEHGVTHRGMVPNEVLGRLLQDLYDYELVEDGLADQPALKRLRAAYLPDSQRLLLNKTLTNRQRAFQYGKELGFNALQLTDRAYTSSLLRVNSFEEVLSHFKAGYFSAALLIDRATFAEDLRELFAQPRWEANRLLDLIKKYRVSPETLFQRMTNLLPELFGLRQLFFLRMLHTPATGNFRVDKELHLDQRHHPHANGLNEHYCRRWLSTGLLNKLQAIHETGSYVGTIVGVQRSFYHGTDDEYLCITLARPGYPTPDRNVSVTLGLLLSDHLRALVRFHDDPQIAQREVNTTCERCPIQDCTERVAPPRVIQRRESRRAVERALDALE